MFRLIVPSLLESMPTNKESVDTVRSSRAGHTFHERWAARRALQLIFPKDGLFAIAVEGISSTETAAPGDEAEDVADLVLYYGVSAVSTHGTDLWLRFKEGFGLVG